MGEGGPHLNPPQQGGRGPHLDPRHRERIERGEDVTPI